MTESFRTNLVNVACAYKNALGIRVTDTSLKKSLTENPYYPSLYSLSNVFDRYQIEHAAFRVDKENIDELSTPFIAWMDKQNTGKDFVTVTSVNPDTVTYISEKKIGKTVPREEFQKDFEGIVLKTEANTQSGEVDYAQKRTAERRQRTKKRVLIFGALILFLWSTYSFINSLESTWVAPAIILLLIKVTGTAVAILLLIYETDKSNSFVKNICTAGRHTNCEAVLGSRAAKVAGISWSEVGFFYFTATLLFLLLPAIDFNAKATLLAAANLLAAPYIFFSIYYQWRVVKQWCPLCLTVQGVLLAELVLGIWNAWMGNAIMPGVHTITPMVLCTGVPVIAWFAIKPLLASHKEAPLYKAAYKRLLYNPDTFQQLLQQQLIAPDGYQNIGITIGNPDAENTIIKVCNPYYGPCAKAHPVLDEIIHNNRNVKLKLIFTASNDKDDVRGNAARHLVAIHKYSPEKTTAALDDWYLAEKKDYGVFAEKYPMNGEIEAQSVEIDKMKAWCDIAEIRFTPTIFINGHRLPEQYKIEELKYIL